MTDSAIVGAGLTAFGKFDGESLKVLAGRAIEAALADAGVDRNEIDMAFVANSVGAVAIHILHRGRRSLR